MDNKFDKYKYPYKKCSECKQSLYPAFFEKEVYKTKTITVSGFNNQKMKVGEISNCCFFSSMSIYGLQFVLKRYNIETYKLSGLNSLFKELYSDSLKDLIPSGTGLFKKLSKYPKSDIYSIPVPLNINGEKK